jgi:hypothetical protein
MDEGFDSYFWRGKNYQRNKENPSAGSTGYIRLATSGIEQPQTTLQTVMDWMRLMELVLTQKVRYF